MASTASSRYSAVAVTLHWLIALALLAMIPLGWWMGDTIHSADPAARSQAAAAFQLHKSIGFTILALSAARLVWRLTHKPPPLPGGMAAWERFAAHGAQWGFYVLMFALPLSGWVYVSTGYSAELDQWVKVPTLLFGGPQVPHLPFIASQGEAARIAISEASMNAHSKMAWGVIGLTVLHVGGALKHHFISKDDVLVRMAPGLVTIAIVAAALVGAVAIFPKPRPAVATAAPTPIEVPAPVAAPPEPVIEPVVEPTPSTAETPAPAGPPPVWTVVPAASAIGFSGTHDGKPFQGRFESWRADIRFDPDNLAASKARVTIQTGSAKTGDRFQETTLVEGEWFDSASHPQATFETTRIRALGPGRYRADGRLTIKGKSAPVQFPFTLAITGATATMKGALTLDRAALDLGMSSDPGFSWVSKEIAVTIAVEARRAP